MDNNQDDANDPFQFKVYRLNKTAAALARKAADEVSKSGKG